MSDPIDLSRMPIILGSDGPAAAEIMSNCTAEDARRMAAAERRWAEEFAPFGLFVAGPAKVYISKPGEGGWQFVGETVGPVIIEERAWPDGT